MSLSSYLQDNLDFAKKMLSPNYVPQENRSRLKIFIRELKTMLEISEQEIQNIAEISSQFYRSCDDLYIPTCRNQIMPLKWRKQFIKNIKIVIEVLLKTSLTLEQFQEYVRNKKELEEKENAESWRQYELKKLEYKIPESIQSALVGINYIHFNYKILICCESENDKVFKRIKDLAVGTKFEIGRATDCW